MRITSILALACLASTCQAAFAQPGSAPSGQAGTPLETPTSTQPPVGVSATPPQAPPASAARTDGAMVGEVIVTANRRAENLQNVPLSVTAVSAANLTNSGVTNLQNLADVVPGLTVQDAGFETTHLRGVGSSAIGPGVENPIAVYVDGVYYPTVTTGLIDFVDVSQVEVLKGPQGTLFGRNATGGLVQVTTKTPTHDLHLDMDASYGNYDAGKVDLYVTGGLTDKLAADLAVQASAQGEGYGVNHATGKDVDQNDGTIVARSKWLFDASPSTRLTTIFDYSQIRASFVAIQTVPGTALPAFLGSNYKFSNAWDTNTDAQPILSSKGGGVSTRLEQDLGFARFIDTVAYRQSQLFYTLDLDGTSTPFESGHILARDASFSEEAQLQSQKGDRVQYTAGAFYYHDDAKYAPGNQIQFPGFFDPIAPFDALGLIGQQVTTSAAGYIQATTEILPATNLTLGARYTYERRALAALEQGVVPGDIIVATLGAVNAAKDFGKPTYRVALDHRFSDEVLAYASFNTGFKSGGFNTQSPADPPFNQETLTAYEVGLKTDLLDRRLRLNGSFFYYDYQHVQVELLEQAGTGVVNGPNAVVYGTDIDFEGRLTPDFTVSGGVEYVHDRFTKATPLVPFGTPGGGVPLTTEGSADGNRLPVTPDSVVDLRGDYKFDLLGGKANANLTYQYNTGWYAEPDNLIHQPAFSLLNASVRWKSPNQTYTVSVYGTNLTNAEVQAFGSTVTLGAQLRTLAPPRLYGVTVGYHF